VAITRVRLSCLLVGLAFSRGKRTRRVMQAWVFAGVVGLGLSACGGSSPNQPTPVTLPAAVSKTERIATGRVTETLSASQGGQSLSLLNYRFTFDDPRKLLAA